MSDKKISELTELETSENDDIIVIVDNSETDINDKTKKQTKQNLLKEALDCDNHTSGENNKVFTADEQSKLNGIEENADVTDSENVGSSINGVDSKATPVDTDYTAIIDSEDTNSLKKLSWANIKATLKTYFDDLYAAALGEDDNYVTDAEKIVIENTSGTNTGDQDLSGLMVKANNLSDLTDAATARFNLNVDIAGTDNSTNVTLAGALSYLTLAGQEITLNAINLTTDITGTLPLANGGTGLSAIAAGSVLVAQSANTLSALTSATGTYYLKNTDGVLSWGEVAGGGQEVYDCIVDAAGGADYTDIQSAITAGCKNIFVKDGTYTLSADIIFAESETVLVGQSWDTIIDCGASYQINLNNNSNCVVKNFKVTGSSTSKYAIYYGGADSKILNNYVDAIKCILMSNYRINIENNFITGANGQVGIFGGYRNSITNNHIYGFGTSTSGSEVTGIRSYDYTIISNNTLRNIGNSSAQDVIGIRSSAYCALDSNIIEDINGATSTYSVIGMALYGSNNAVNANILKGIGSSTGVTCYGINAIYGGNSNIVGNNIYNVGNASNTNESIGIYLVNNSTLSGNIISSMAVKTSGGYTTKFIYIDGSRNAVTGNNLNTANGDNIYGIDAYNCESSIITGNLFDYNITWDKYIYTRNAIGYDNYIYANDGVPTTSEQEHYDMKNNSGATRYYGEIVTLNAVANGEEITTTTTQGDDLVFGVMATNVVNGGYGRVQTKGKTTALKVDGTTDIAIGDFIGTSTTAGIGMKASSGDMAIAIALEAYTGDDTNGVIDALIISPRKI